MNQQQDLFSVPEIATIKNRSELLIDVNQPDLLPEIKPYYSTTFGRAYLEDSLEVLKIFPDSSINLVITSPPYALHFKKRIWKRN